MTTNVTAEDFLAHHGILGMHWGQHTAGPTASGISSHSVDAQAKADAKRHVRANLSKKTDVNTKSEKTRIKNLVEKRSAANPDYAKAFAYHQPIAAHTAKVKSRIAKGAVIGGVTVYTAHAFKPELMALAYKAGTTIATHRGAKIATVALKQIGHNEVITLAKGAGGVFSAVA